MAYLPLPISGFKLAVYVVRHRHQNHAIVGCMLKQTVFTVWGSMKNGVSEIVRRDWEMDSRHSCMQKFHLRMKWSCKICLPSEWWGHLLEIPRSAEMQARKKYHQYVLPVLSDSITLHKFPESRLVIWVYVPVCSYLGWRMV